jgi:hypothetical protein
MINTNFIVSAVTLYLVLTISLQKRWINLSNTDYRLPISLKQLFEILSEIAERDDMFYGWVILFLRYFSMIVAYFWVLSFFLKSKHNHLVKNMYDGVLEKELGIYSN